MPEIEIELPLSEIYADVALQDPIEDAAATAG